MTPQQYAFLNMLAISEGTSTVKSSDNGYNVIVGGKLFGTPPDCYIDHPRKLVDLTALGIKSTAAGRYQLLARYFDAYKEQLGLTDFSPASQDTIALQQIKECGALDDIEDGDLGNAIMKCAHIWASLPGASYGQHENAIGQLRLAFANAGGELADS